MPPLRSAYGKLVAYRVGLLVVFLLSLPPAVAGGVWAALLLPVLVTLGMVLLALQGTIRCPRCGELVIGYRVPGSAVSFVWSAGRTCRSCGRDLAA